MQRKLIVACLVCIVLVTLAGRLFIIAQVSGRSMESAFQDGDYVVGLRLPRRQHWFSSAIKVCLIRRGAVVFVQPPEQPGILLIKRVDGLAGDVRSWQTDERVTTTQGIPDQHVFVLSDSTAQAYPLADSRLYGPFPYKAITARAWLKL